MSKTVRIAIAGCCHGELHKIYSHITSRPKKEWPQLLIICGDFQSLRSEADFDSISVPDKYKKLGDFKDFYKGVSRAPVLTIFASGNHEASNYLHELQLGGWVAPNIYFMGYSNVLWCKGLRIAGWSGIYNDMDFYKAHFETLPLDRKSKRSIYHTRFEDFVKLSLIKDRNVNVFVSHDWPEGIVHSGDLKSLLKKKPFFKSDISKGELGSPAGRELLKILKPQWWFSAHLHVKFSAIVAHDSPPAKRSSSTNGKDVVKKLKVNEDEIDLELDDQEESDPTLASKNNDEISLDLDDRKKDEADLYIDDTNKDEITLDLDVINDDEIKLDLKETAKVDDHKELARGFPQTNFLALDKPLPRRDFLDFIDIPITNQDHPSNKTNQLYYDEEFLKIKKWFDTSFKMAESYQRLKLENVDSSLSEQFSKDIDSIELLSDNFELNQTFEAIKENPAAQTQQLLEKYGL